ncbi:MAG: hypothetical protein N4A33_03425 [Bacteriovoracaceae bacterium]|jgi:16S rRNA (cytidine1402-2'-O)-methyltransferase|nr:hypothetical protein [Bacteriovoracaceae bacterium]
MSLILVPTPIDDTSELPVSTVEFIKNKINEGALICVEEVKEGRRRWLRFGLPREAIEDFILYNEHTRDKLNEQLISSLKKKKDILLMSDCGLPAFCDPGASLVDLCHQRNIKVTSTPFYNSIALSIALSGYDHSRFIFEGFVPVKTEARMSFLKRVLKQNDVSVIMDTPYRMKSLLEDMNKVNPDRLICLLINLNKEDEYIIRDSVKSVNKKIEKAKKEFIIVIGKN